MLNKALLRAVIADQATIRIPTPFFKREIYARLLAWQNNTQIIVLSGIRRSGKSTLLQQVRQHAHHKNCYLNFDDDRLLNFEISDFQSLLEVFIELYGDERTLYFDEIQNISGWERFIRRAYDQGYKIYLTGSNSNMLSKELGTRLTGRYLQIQVYPLSFKEFVQIYDPSLLTKKTFTTRDKGLIQHYFQQYWTTGGMPEYVLTAIPDVLQLLYQNILYRDIVVRYSLNNELPIKELMYYLASHVGKDVSFNALKAVIGVKNASTVSEYCHYLENSYLAFFVRRYDASLKKQIQKKGYLIDHALARIIGFRPTEDRGRILENIVFLELKRRECDIYFHRDKKECDFLLRHGTQIQQAIQVCQAFTSEETEQQEIAGLLEAMNAHGLGSGLILVEDLSQTTTVLQHNKDIHFMPISLWLLDTAEKTPPAG